MNNQAIEKTKEKLPLVGIGPKLLSVMCPLFVLLGILNSIYYPFFQIPIRYYLLFIAGAGLITIGMIVFIYSERILSVAHDSSNLVITKFYAYVRHPMYASWGLGVLPGIFFLINSWLFFLTLIVYYISVRIFIKKEEKYLLEKFGKKYAHYKKNVNLFFPNVKKYKPEQQ
ncbi:MAG: isoprenylcysteine carboxylmethyltransferase family protein [Candidatus Lokiarchaeia archaeon]|nr:isoprenylcysteine carboxylmethyltransferase family protein [Candidatus Lokiarchaeia archaeon]